MNPFVDGNSIFIKNGLIDEIGNVNFRNIESSDVTIDADGATIIPGFIDSYVHITFSDLHQDKILLDFYQVIYMEGLLHQQHQKFMFLGDHQIQRELRH